MVPLQPHALGWTEPACLPCLVPRPTPALCPQPLRLPPCAATQTGYDKHVREGGCSSSGKEGDELERLQHLAQLVRCCLERFPTPFSEGMKTVGLSGPAGAWPVSLWTVLLRVAAGGFGQAT